MTFYDRYAINQPMTPVSSSVPMADYLHLVRKHEELKLTLERATSTPGTMRRIFDYYGSKWSTAEWIVSLFPVHEVYIEPFLGSGGVFFTKPASKREIIGDLYQDLVRFFRVLRSQPDALIRSIMLTPYAEAEFNAAKTGTGDDLEMARRFYVQSRMGWGGGGITGRSFRRDRTAARTESLPTIFRLIGSLYQAAARLQNAQIDCANAYDQIARYDSPTALFYIDPPYVKSERGGSSDYFFDMTTEDHVRLSETLHSCKGMVVLSGYASDLYTGLYGDWLRVDKKTRDMIAGEQRECVWLSPAAAHARPQKHLFELA